MAITIHIYYKGTGDAAKQFAKEMTESGTVDAIRREEGNLCYEYFLPLEEEETVLLIDSWENQKAIDLHHASPMMNTIMKLREKYDLHMRGGNAMCPMTAFRRQTENSSRSRQLRRAELFLFAK